MRGLRAVKGSGWSSVGGAELVEAHAEGSLGDLLQECSAIYMWKRNLHRNAGIGVEARQLTAWLDRLIDSPHGATGRRRLGHFLEVSSIELRPAALTERQSTILKQWLTEPKRGRWLLRYLSHLAPHTPALYVGETGNIRQRTRDHMRANTDFGRTIEAFLPWEQLDLHYYELGPQSEDESQLRKALEYMTTALTIGGFTQRPG